MDKQTKTVQLRIRNLSEKTHKAFMLMCVQEGVSMNEKLLEFIETSMKKYKKHEPTRYFVTMALISRKAITP